MHRCWLICVFSIAMRSAEAQHQAWAARYGAITSGDDRMVAAVQHESGDIFATGQTEHAVLTVRFDSAGNVLWEARYIDAAAFVTPTAIQTDSTGNVYVGCSENWNNLLVIKYDPSGVQQWVTRHHDDNRQDGTIAAMVVDATAHVVVVGSSFTSYLGDDMITMKLSPEGGQQWVRYFDGQLHTDDYGRAVVLDSDGCTYVCGTIDAESSGGGHFETIKYGPDGSELWSRTYAPGHGWPADAQSMVATPDGGLVVCGHFFSGLLDRDRLISVVKYSAIGAQEWASVYDRGPFTDTLAERVTVDAEGNIYVIGHTLGNGCCDYYDFVTVKYNSVGEQQWATVFAGDEHGYDYATGVAVDTNGDVFVTGPSWNMALWPYFRPRFATVKYDSNGNYQWATYHAGPGDTKADPVGLFLAPNGTVCVAGTVSSGEGCDGFAVVRYSSDGAQIGSNRHDGPGGLDEYATAMTVDAAGNSFITGQSRVASCRYPVFHDFITAAFDAGGRLRWAATHDGPAHFDDGASAIAVNRAGAVFVTGTSQFPDTEWDFATIGYDANGHEEWVNHYDGPAHGTDYAVAVVVDTSGDVIVVGNSMGMGNRYDFATVKYDSRGREQWVARYEGPADAENSVYSLGVDNTGSVYLLGSSLRFGPLPREEGIVLKYDRNGREQWLRRYAGSRGDGAAFRALSVDPAGDLVVAGSARVDDWRSEFVTIKYDPNGTQQWLANYAGNQPHDGASVVALDRKGNVHVAGFWSAPDTGIVDLVTIMYYNSGIQRWASRYSRPTPELSSPEEIRSIQVDRHGNTWVGATMRTTDHYFDIATIKYGPDGTQRWASTFASAGNGYDAIAGLGLDSAGNVFAGGISTSELGDSDLVILKYARKRSSDQNSDDGD